jgi:hypothetical protein
MMALDLPRTLCDTRPHTLWRISDGDIPVIGQPVRIVSVDTPRRPSMPAYPHRPARAGPPPDPARRGPPQGCHRPHRGADRPLRPPARLPLPGPLVQRLGQRPAATRLAGDVGQGEEFAGQVKAVG